MRQDAIVAILAQGFLFIFHAMAPKKKRVIIAPPAKRNEIGIEARNAAKLAARMAAGGAYYECPQCAGVAWIPEVAGEKRFRCLLGRVSLPNDFHVTCKFYTQAQNWQKRVMFPTPRAKARLNAVRDYAVELDAAIQAKPAEERGSFWDPLRAEVRRRVPSEGPLAEGCAEEDHALRHHPYQLPKQCCIQVPHS